MKPEMEAQEWMVNGSCREVAAELFFPEPRDYPTERAAKQICLGCSVLTECRAYALEHRPAAGVWGGLSVRELERVWWRSAS